MGDSEVAGGTVDAAMKVEFVRDAGDLDGIADSGGALLGDLPVDCRLEASQEHVDPVPHVPIRELQRCPDM